VTRNPAQHVLLVVCCVLAPALCAPTSAQPRTPGPGAAADPDRVAAVKAGMVVNFIRYTTWPDSAFQDGERAAPIVVAIIGESDITAALADAADGRVISGREIEIRRLRHPAADGDAPDDAGAELEEFHRNLRESHLVYFGESERDRYAAVLGTLADAPVLTVSDIRGFAEGGGMLGLSIRDRRMSFDANEEAVKAAALKVSAQVLRLARIVRTREEPPRRPGQGGGP